MIDKLKTESGTHWTSKLQDMMKDMDKSKELMISFRQKYQLEDVEFNACICTTGIIHIQLVIFDAKRFID